MDGAVRVIGEKSRVKLQRRPQYPPSLQLSARYDTRSTRCQGTDTRYGLHPQAEKPKPKVEVQYSGNKLSQIISFKQTALGLYEDEDKAATRSTDTFDLSSLGDALDPQAAALLLGDKAVSSKKDEGGESKEVQERYERTPAALKHLLRYQEEISKWPTQCLR